MDEICFDILYDEDNNQSLSAFLLWVDDFADSFVDSKDFKLEIDSDKAYAFVSNLRQDEFPANGGFERASPFKKAANIYVYLHAVKPFLSGFPAEIIGEEIATIRSATESIVGFGLIQQCLLNAEIKRNGDTIFLERSIEVSRHFLGDLIDASQGISPSNHFKTFSLLFESLVYQANDGIAFEKIFSLNTD